MVITRLNPKNNRFDSGGGGFGGLSQSDIAAACKGLSELQIALIYFYWCGQNAYRQYLVYMAEQELKAVDEDIRRRMAELLIQDLYDSTCNSCNGTGFNRHKRKCGRCSGSGRRGASIRVLAGSIGVSASTFRRRHIDIYKKVIARFEKMAFYSAEQMRSKLG